MALLRKTLILLAILGVLTIQTTAGAANKPNVVYLLADDLGWGDLSVNGDSIATLPKEYLKTGDKQD
jgi:arylsulfatase A